VTDLYYYKHTGERYRARLSGTYYRYLYNGERVLEELNDSGTMQARYTTENDSYYGQWLHLYRPTGSLSSFPMPARRPCGGYDNIGSTRGLLDASGTATDWYELDTFGRQVSSSGTTPNPYRFGAAWGYITDPSGFLQLGERYYWPEVGRFVQRDPAGGPGSRSIYADDNPVTEIDPEGLCPVGYLVPGMPCGPPLRNPPPAPPPPPIQGFGKCMKYAKETAKHYQSVKANDKWKHCVVSCKVAKMCGSAFAGLVGVGKEVQDIFGPGNAEWGDLQADYAGIALAENCPSKQCEDSCSAKYKK